MCVCVCGGGEGGIYQDPTHYVSSCLQWSDGRLRKNNCALSLAIMLPARPGVSHWKAEGSRFGKAVSSRLTRALSADAAADKMGTASCICALLYVCVCGLCCVRADQGCVLAQRAAALPVQPAQHHRMGAGSKQVRLPTGDLSCGAVCVCVLVG